jgi:hypothetical protein
MQLTPHCFDDLSDIQYQIFTQTDARTRRATVMILQFSGTFGGGSAGNDDGVVMRMITFAALSVWHADGVVFDLRELNYVWGDKIWEIFGCGIDPSGVEQLPYATVISDRCRQGFSTCMSIVEPVFEELEPAITNVRDRAQRALDDVWAEIDTESG